MYIHVHEFISLYVHCTYTCIDVNTCLESNFGLCTDTSVQLHNHTSFPIRPDQPCDAGESQLRAGAAPSEQPSSWHQSFQLTDHPGVACLAQTATATGSPHTHCCPAVRCCSVTAAHREARPLVLAVLVRNGRGQVTSQVQADQWNSAHHVERTG